MTAMPRDVRINRAWISPYSSSDALSIMSLCSSVRFSSARGAGISEASAAAAEARRKRRGKLGWRTRRQLDIEDRVQRVLVVWHLARQPGEVEIVLDVILVDLAEELVPLERAEPLDPGDVVLLLRDVAAGAVRLRDGLRLLLLRALRHGGGPPGRVHPPPTCRACWRARRGRPRRGRTPRLASPRASSRLCGKAPHALSSSWRRLANTFL